MPAAGGGSFLGLFEHAHLPCVQSAGLFNDLLHRGLLAIRLDAGNLVPAQAEPVALGIQHEHLTGLAQGYAAYLFQKAFCTWLSLMPTYSTPTTCPPASTMGS